MCIEFFPTIPSTDRLRQEVGHVSIAMPTAVYHEHVSHSIIANSKEMQKKPSPADQAP